jgi:hypothetical protein
MSQQQQRLTQIDMAIELLNGGAVHVLGPKKATVTKRNLLKTEVPRGRSTNRKGNSTAKRLLDRKGGVPEKTKEVWMRLLGPLTGELNGVQKPRTAIEMRLAAGIPGGKGQDLWVYWQLNTLKNNGLVQLVDKNGFSHNKKRKGVQRFGITQKGQHWFADNK